MRVEPQVGRSEKNPRQTDTGDVVTQERNDQCPFDVLVRNQTDDHRQSIADFVSRFDEVSVSPDVGIRPESSPQEESGGDAVMNPEREHKRKVVLCIFVHNTGRSMGGVPKTVLSKYGSKNSVRRVHENEIEDSHKSHLYNN
mmetsp:Transcript_49789/g.97375  ORF Transcript_49789/g.97375 Transcript_49789/m.97375 type:complete len:142 (+) Transcript_49789:498-923(+)